MKMTYPVIFTEVDTNILIEVPDLEILTEANEEGGRKGTPADGGPGLPLCAGLCESEGTGGKRR